jgi:hypothetical protein
LIAHSKFEYACAGENVVKKGEDEMARALLSAAILMGSVTVAVADKGVSSDPPSTERERTWAVSTSVLRPAVAQQGELGAEYHVRDNMAASITVALSPFDIYKRDMAGNFSADTVLCVSTGAQFRYTVLGTFEKGAFAGAEAQYIHVNRDAATSVRPEHEALWLGPHIGYKHTFDFGLMLSATFTVGLPVYRRDGIPDEEIPGNLDDLEDPPVVGDNILLWPNLSIGWAL